jgi:ABC-type multidrug transport system permease subunit
MNTLCFIFTILVLWIIIDMIILIISGALDKMDALLENKFLFPILFFPLWLIGVILILLRSSK